MTSPADETNPLIEAAHLWFKADYCVIPSHDDGGKRPFGLWSNFQDKRMEWDNLLELLNTGKYTGIGVITGKASGNVEMLEIEGPSDAAVERLRRVIDYAKELDRQAGDTWFTDLINRVTRGCVERSAGGGLHFFIRVLGALALGNTKLAHDRDGKVIAETRGQGGFVIVAPTPARTGHPEGATYAFARGTTPAGTVDVTSEERDALHMLFTLALNEHDEEPQPERKTTTPQATGDGAFDAYRATPWADILEPAGWTWSHKHKDRDYWVRPGKTKTEGISATTIEDGPMVNFSTSVNMPIEKGMSKADVYAHLHHSGDLKAAARDLQQQGYGQPPTNKLTLWQPDPDLTDEENEQTYQEWLNEIHDKFPRLDWKRLWEDDQEEEWIVEPLLAARRLVALYSAPKVGKSLLMLEIAAAIANGKAMFGYPPPQRAHRTLYIDFENDPRGDVRSRLIDMGYEPGQLDNLVFLSFPTIAALDSEKGSEELMAVVNAYQCEIVVIDTVSRSIKGEENENDTWLAFYRHTGLKLKQAGVALIRLDHAGKDESKGQRGGSAKSGDVDAVWRMSKDGEDLITLVCEAQRFPIDEKELTIRRLENPLRHEPIGNAARIKRDALLKDLATHNLPKNRDMTLREVRKAARDAGVKFKNSALTTGIWEMYCRLPTTWEATQIEGLEGSK